MTDIVTALRASALKRYVGKYVSVLYLQDSGNEASYSGYLQSLENGLLTFKPVEAVSLTGISSQPMVVYLRQVVAVHAKVGTTINGQTVYNRIYENKNARLL